MFLIADASPLIAFFNGHEHDLLFSVVRLRANSIHVPDHVDLEIRRNCGKNGMQNYLEALAKDDIQVFEEPRYNGTYSRVLEWTFELLDVDVDEYGSYTKDAGEAFAVAHCRDQIESGASAEILIDDRRGRKWAQDWSIPIRRTLWVFEEAKQLKLITTKQEMVSSYESVAIHTKALYPIGEEPGLLEGLG